MDIKRAHFSAVTYGDVMNAMKRLGRPNKNLADAVQARQEIDLRLGASFTRFQSINFKSLLGVEKDKPVSYGPCQFPTLGFVVERYQKIRDFKPQKFWILDLRYEEGKFNVKFNWRRNKIFDKVICFVIYQKSIEAKEAEVTKYNTRKIDKKRPHPLNTIQMQKLVTSKLKMSSAQAMKVAEALYNRGYISYPRTETTKYNKTFNLRDLVKKHENSNDWGDFAQRIVDGDLYGGPRNGTSDDKAHPPIHPVKSGHKSEMKPEEWAVYNLITRHFLAAVSKNAEGLLTTLE